VPKAGVALIPSPRRLPARPLAAEDARSSGRSPPDASLPAEAHAEGLYYDLRALVAHEGTTPQSGQYVSYAQNKVGKWQLFNDSLVRGLPALSFEGVGRQAYVLFYVLREGCTDAPAANSG
jgi:hypothetical protein